MAWLLTYVLLVPLGVARATLYPDGHWSLATEISEENADDFVKYHVDEMRTVFIRWATPGEEHAEAQSPAWRQVLEEFKGSPDVVFGDVPLSKGKVDQIHGFDQHPGQNGWPHIRYFNKVTGYSGLSYRKHTGLPLHDELGTNQKYMRKFVEEESGATLCSVTFPTEDDCTPRQLKFVQEMTAKDTTEQQGQLRRLDAMLTSQHTQHHLKSDMLTWMKQRKSILKQLLDNKENAEL